jgi:hypothetical protein
MFPQFASSAHTHMCPTTTRQALRCVKKKKRKEQGLWTRQIAQEMRCVALYFFFGDGVKRRAGRERE